MVQEFQFQEYLVLLCYQVILAHQVGLEAQGHLEDLLHHLYLGFQAGQASLAGLWSDPDHLLDLAFLAALGFLEHLVGLFHLLDQVGQSQQGP